MIDSHLFYFKQLLVNIACNLPSACWNVNLVITCAPLAVSKMIFQPALIVSICFDLLTSFLFRIVHTHFCTTHDSCTYACDPNPDDSRSSGNMDFSLWVPFLFFLSHDIFFHLTVKTGLHNPLLNFAIQF